jgi:membrane associated rhomboid family serine protease
MQRLPEVRSRQMKAIGIGALIALIVAFVGAGIAAAGDGKLGYLVAATGVIGGAVCMLLFAVTMIVSWWERRSNRDASRS